MTPPTEHLPTIPPQRPRRVTRPTVVGVLAGLLALVLLVLLTPWPASGPENPDNTDLYLDVRRSIENGARQNLGIAEVRGGEVRFAGADPDREFEIGSVSKTFTAALLADAVERGEISEEDTLGTVLPDAGLAAPLDSITLAELASHRAGLPRLSPGADAGTLIWSSLARTDPYTESPGELLAALRGVSLSGRGDVQYSNFGVAILGLALEEATGMAYPDLLNDRLFTPLGMEDSYAPMTPEGLRDGAPRGLTIAYLPSDPWTLGSSAPAGGIRSTPRDMAVYLRAVMEGTAPGADAARPRFPDPEGGGQVGLGWFVQGEGDDALTWHNGGTGGFTAVAGFRASGDHAIVVLSDVAVSVDGALELLEAAP